MHVQCGRGLKIPPGYLDRNPWLRVSQLLCSMKWWGEVPPQRMGRGPSFISWIQPSPQTKTCLGPGHWGHPIRLRPVLNHLVLQPVPLFVLQLLLWCQAVLMRAAWHRGCFVCGVYIVNHTSHIFMHRVSCICVCMWSLCHR